MDIFQKIKKFNLPMAEDLLATKKIFVVAAVFMMALAVYFWARPNDYVLLLKQEDIIQLSIKDAQLSVEVADTEQEKITGLSNRASLAGDTGMLFVYDEPTRPSFWMKDMLFSIDIIWIDESKIISEINPQILPETYPQTFSPKNNIKYVLEVNAGSAAKFNWQIGDEVVF